MTGAVIPVAPVTPKHMDILRKVLAVIVMILAVIGLLLCVGGLIGAWAVNGPATNMATGVLGALESYLSIADRAAETAAASLNEAQEGVDRVNQSVANLTSEDKAQAAQAIRQTVDESLGPTVARTRAIVSGVGDTVVQFNKTLESVNSIPGVRVPTLTDELQAAEQRIDQVEAAIGDVKSSVADAASFDGSRVTAATATASNELQAAQIALAQGQARIQATSAAIASAKASVPGLIDTLSAAASLLFILFGVGQVFLFLAALRWFRQPEHNDEVAHA